jgi:hypothetical protein
MEARVKVQERAMALEPLFHIKENLGATQASGDSEAGAVRFRLFLPEGFDPQIASIGVAGDFQSKLGGSDWDFSNSLPLGKTSTPGIGDFSPERLPRLV